ncbi:hypothetical protein pb186bvf_014208 [Paramecium bursaria]
MLFYIIIKTILCSSIHLTDSLTNVIVIQEGYENFTIEVASGDFKIDNQSVQFVNTTTQCNGLNIETTNENDINLNKGEYNLSSQFCVVDEWSPLYQPVHFYLSPQSIDLILFNNEEVVVSIEKSIHANISEIYTNIYCMSIFPIWSDLELFGVDCNLDINNQTVKAFLLYKTILDKETQYIKDFEYNTTLMYYYEDNETDTLMDLCRQRLVEPISLLEYIPEDMAILYTYTQYCPFNNINIDVVKNFDKIYIIDIMYEPVQYFDPLILNVEELCHFGQLEQLIPNMLLRKFSEDSWNLGLLQNGHSGICKCQVQYDPMINVLSPICTYTKLLFFQDAYFQSLHVINDNLVLLAGNDYSIQIIKLDDSIHVNDYQDLIYKDIYTEGYQIVDVTITTSYINVILSQSQENYNSQIIQMCLAKDYNFTNGTNILKIFQIQENKQEVYYQINVPTNAKLLTNYNYMTLAGQYISLYLVSEQPKIFLKKVYNKMIIIQYQSNQTFICDQSQQIEEYYAVVAQFNISGLVDNQKVSLTRYLVVCIIQYNNELLNLVAYRLALNISSFDNKCPNPMDKLYYNFRTNQIDLLQGVMGPLLYYEYIPDPVMTQFYPFYQDYIYKLDHKKILDEKIYKLYYSKIEDSDSDNTVIGKLQIVTSIEMAKNLILYYQCDLKSLNKFQEEIIFNLQLVVSDCELRQRVHIKKTQQIDYYKRIDNVEFFVDFKMSQLYFLIDGYDKLDTIDNFNLNQPFKQVEIQKSNQEYNRQYYEITILTDQANSIILFYYFSIDYISNKIYNTSELYYRQNIIIDQAESFQYYYIGQQVISILTKNGSIDFYTYGSIQSNLNPLIPNFTNLVYIYQIDQCANSESIGFQIVDQQSNLNIFKKYLLVWCLVNNSGYNSSIILQYHIDSINQIYFWRQLPTYNQTINISKPLVISGNILYLPIVTQNLLISRYYIYNLIDYSGRMLLQYFDIKNDYVLASSCEGLNLASQNKYQSFTYFITAHEQFLYYVNSEAQFIFNQKNATSLYQNLTIGIFQPTNQVTLYRTYQLVYNKYVNEIFTKKKVFIIDLSDTAVSQETGYFNYTISISQNIFVGPITNYEAHTNNSNVTIVPGQYIQFNKYMGKYVDSIELYGNIQQMLSLSNPQYASFYGFDIDPTFNEVQIYQDIILVLTSKALLFLQANSIKDAGPFDDCNFLKYNQTQQNSNNTCSIRKLHVYNIEKEIKLEFCKIEIFYITQIALICLNNTSPSKRQNLKIINYKYSQDINQIQIIDMFDTYSEYYQLFFSRYRTFLFNNNTYLASETTFQNSQSYFQVYSIIVSERIVSQQPKIIQGLQAPVQKSSDFSITLLYNNGTITLVFLILQPDSILFLNIDLEDLIVIERRNIVIQQLIDQITPLIIFYVNFENINYLTALQTLNYYPYLPILIGNIGYNLEVLIKLTSLTLELQYTFIQDQICQYDIIQLPQYLLSKKNGTIEYLITVCLNFEFNYQTIYQEMVYLFGYQNQNLIYTTLFVREDNSKYSFPVQIMETVLINPERLQFYNYQVYRSASYQANTAHILMTNYTYFLVDYEIYSTFIFDILYPIQDKEEQVIVIDVYASNQIKNNSVQYQLYLPFTQSSNKYKIWFYVLLAIIVFFIFALFVVIVNGKVNQARKIRKQSITFKLNGKNCKYDECELQIKNDIYYDQ